MPVIERVEVTEFSYDVENLGFDAGDNRAYEPGRTTTLTGCALRISDDEGCVGEYVTAHVGKNRAAIGQMFGLLPLLPGRDPLQRERHYQHFRRLHRHLGGVGYSAIDICLWDYAGRRCGKPIWQMLGGWRRRLPSYASTLHGDRTGGLSSPAAFADFAVQCRGLGYRGFKIHGWSEGNPREEARSIAAVARAVGGQMDLMIDPACELRTFQDALHVGRACDEAGFVWLEDPFQDGGWSTHAHSRLRQMIRTPLLMTEHVRGLEPKAAWITERATDYLRADPEYDLGITGTMKIAVLAEAFGMDVELHAAGPAQRHCMAAIRNTNYYELSLVHPKVCNPIPPVYTCGYSDALEAVGNDGCFPVPDGPGLGVSYDWDYIRAHALNEHVHAN